MNYLDEIDYTTAEFGDLYDELPLWSAPFGLMLLECVELRNGITILDVGAGTGFLAVELAQRCGRNSRVIAVDPWAASMTRLQRKLVHLADKIEATFTALERELNAVAAQKGGLSLTVPMACVSGAKALGLIAIVHGPMQGAGT